MSFNSCIWFRVVFCAFCWPRVRSLGWGLLRYWATCRCFSGQVDRKRWRYKNCLMNLTNGYYPMNFYFSEHTKYVFLFLLSRVWCESFKRCVTNSGFWNDPHAEEKNKQTMDDIKTAFGVTDLKRGVSLTRGLMSGNQWSYFDKFITDKNDNNYLIPRPIIL